MPFGARKWLGKDNFLVITEVIQWARARGAGFIVAITAVRGFITTGVLQWARGAGVIAIAIARGFVTGGKSPATP